jgi:hypothetical protein
VISRDDDFVPMWQFTEPEVEISNRMGPPGEHAEVSRVNQDVAAWHLPLAM